MPPLPALENLVRITERAWNSLGVWFTRAAAETNSGIQGGLARRWWPFLIMLGLSLGIGLKVLAEHTFTIGFEDYRVDMDHQRLDVNGLEDALNQTASQSEEPKQYPAERIETQP